MLWIFIKSSTIPAKDALLYCIIMSIQVYFGIGLLVCGSKDIISLPNSDGRRLDRISFCRLALCFGLVGFAAPAPLLVYLVLVGLVMLAYLVLVGMIVQSTPLSYFVPVGMVSLALLLV